MNINYSLCLNRFSSKLLRYLYFKNLYKCTNILVPLSYLIITDRLNILLVLLSLLITVTKEFSNFKFYSYELLSYF